MSAWIPACSAEQAQRIEISRDEPGERRTQYVVDVARRTLAIEERIRVADCPQTWDSRCWTTSSRATQLSSDDIVAAVSVLTPLVTQSQPVPPAPGSSHYAAMLSFGERNTYATLPLESSAAASVAALLTRLDKR